jgi:hypothetical protein
MKEMYYSIQETPSQQLYLDVYYNIRLHVSTAWGHPYAVFLQEWPEDDCMLLKYVALL